MNEKIKVIFRFILWFALAFVLVWVSGIGILFENVSPLRALIVFSGIIAVIFECINQVYIAGQTKIKELEKRIEELEKQ